MKSLDMVALEVTKIIVDEPILKTQCELGEGVRFESDLRRKLVIPLPQALYGIPAHRHCTSSTYTSLVFIIIILRLAN